MLNFISSICVIYFCNESKHFPEKLIPLVINNALEGKNLPIYGKGNNVRDWLYVDDHVRGIILAFENGKLAYYVVHE